jgi:magnesium-transporting ATPase (P-type)
MTSAPRTDILPEAPHALTPTAALAALDVSALNGLADDEVDRRRQSHGPNTIVSRRRMSALVVFAHQFMSPVVYLLVARRGWPSRSANWRKAARLPPCSPSIR